MGMRWMRTAKISRGKFMEAVAWAKEVSAYAEKRFNTPKIHTYIDAFGDVANLRWVIDYADLASMEKIQTQMLADADYWKMISRASTAEIFIDGSVIDTVMREI